MMLRQKKENARKITLPIRQGDFSLRIYQRAMAFHHRLPRSSQMIRFTVTIDQAKSPLTESLIKKIHAMLKNGTADARLDYFAVGEYKRLPNEVGGKATAPPEDVQRKMGSLLAAYEDGKAKDFDSLLDFHYLSVFWHTPK